MPFDPNQLPADLPVPTDDGAAAHLPGTAVPAIALPSTAQASTARASTGGATMRVDTVPDGFTRLIIYAYPMTGLPGVPVPDGWDEIPGARGCTPQACGFRDHAAELGALGAAVAGLSTQGTAYQQEAATRLRLPFPLLSDADLAVTRALRLPTFDIELAPAYEGGGRRTLLKRITLVVRDGHVEKVFYPIFPPDQHAAEVLRWAAATKL
ncbi:MAG TPA: peroxiredoxin [Streptosporangiaceae bacterium]|jgi:peroxiredoxin|nr:peroxiredoxin [Streptosporangiaceae bacterium]